MTTTEAGADDRETSTRKSVPRSDPKPTPKAPKAPKSAPKSAPKPTRAAARRSQVAALRPAYQAELRDGLYRFFEPRRTDCPWCGSGRLRQRLRTTDLLQHKPGTFTLDECGDCAHVFQNPRLTGAGLEFYYRDFYDGLGEQRLGGVFGTRTAVYAAEHGRWPRSPRHRAAGWTSARGTATSARAPVSSSPTPPSTVWTSARARSWPNGTVGWHAACAARSPSWHLNWPGSTTW